MNEYNPSNMNMTDIANPAPTRHPRLAALAGLLALFQLGAALRGITADPAVPTSLLPGLEFTGGIIWGALFAWASLALAQRRRRAVLVFAWLVIGFSLYSLGRVAAFAQADYDRQRLPFLIGITAAVIILPTVTIVRSLSIVTTELAEHDREP